MMFVFKKLRGRKKGDDEESGIRRGLTSNGPKEIELSEYERVGCESPSRFLTGEASKLEPIADLDLFFERIYSYFCGKGLRCIITKWVVELLSLGFTICFSGFVLLIVDWNALRSATCTADSPCDLVREAIRRHPLTPLTISRAVILGYLLLFSLYWVFCFFRFFAQLPDILKTRDFYKCLGFRDDQLITIEWSTVLDKVVAFQSAKPLCVVKDLSSIEIVMRLMRKENYLIGMINKGVLAFPMWVPGAGPQIKPGHYLILTKTLEWTLNWCILQSMFDRNFYVRMDFISNPGTMKKRFIVVGVAMLLLSPFLVIFMLVYLFLSHAEQFYNHPTTASSRRWSNIALWMFREFNEVDHLFRHRINGTEAHASNYLRQFPAPMITLIAKCISFVSGGITAMFLIVAILDESLLEGRLFGRNLLWYAAVTGAITAVSRAAAADDLLVVDPERALSLVVHRTHYMPKHWRANERAEFVKEEFATLFQYTLMMLLEEMASIFVTPFLLLFVLPKKVDSILRFISDFTEHVDGVGHVCGFSTFNFHSHGNSNYASPYNASKAQRSRQGKMEKSLLSFRSWYPSLESNEEGKQFLANLQKFKEENLGICNCRHSKQRWSDYVLNVDDEEKNLAYLVELYYVSRRCLAPAPPVADSESGELWLPRNLPIEEEEWRDEENLNRIASHMRTCSVLEDSRSQWIDGRGGSFHWMGASSSFRAPSDAIPPRRSQWWDRERSQARDPQPSASFLEPPQFTPRGSHNYDSFIESSYHPYSIVPTRCQDDDDVESGARSSPRLHFDDVYQEPPHSPTYFF